MKYLHRLIGFIAVPLPPRTERGLSQSTEIAILTGGVVVLASAIGIAITAYVNAKLPRP
jgi:hypothetical protein